MSYYDRMVKGGGGELFRHFMNYMTLYVPYLIYGWSYPAVQDKVKVI